MANGYGGPVQFRPEIASYQSTSNMAMPSSVENLGNTGVGSYIARTAQELKEIQDGINYLADRLQMVMCPLNGQIEPTLNEDVGPPVDCPLSQITSELYKQVQEAHRSLRTLINRIRV